MSTGISDNFPVMLTFLPVFVLSVGLVHFRTLVTLRRVRVSVRVGLELESQGYLGLELGLGLG